MPDLLNLLVYVVVTGLVCYLLWWLIGFVGLPEPFDKVARVIVALVAGVILLSVVMGLPVPRLR